MLPALFAKSSVCVNPFINILTQPKIRMDIWRRLHLMSPSISNPLAGSSGAYSNSPCYDFGFSLLRQPISDWRPAITQHLFIGTNSNKVNHDGRSMFARVNNKDDPELTVDEQYSAKIFLHQTMVDLRESDLSPIDDRQQKGISERYYETMV